MCLCKGTGCMTKWNTWGIAYDPCPDSDCQFDKEEAEQAYEKWKIKMKAYKDVHHVEMKKGDAIGGRRY